MVKIKTVVIILKILTNYPNYFDERRHSCTNSNVLEKTSMKKVFPKSENCFFLAFLQIMML